MDGVSMIFGAGCTIVGALLGAVASWYFSRKYYRKSSKDLDAALLLLSGNHQVQRRCFTALACMLEQEGIGKASYDADGNLSGVVVTVSAHAIASSTAFGVATVTRGESPRYDRQHEQPEIEKRDSPDA